MTLIGLVIQALLRLIGRLLYLLLIVSVLAKGAAFAGALWAEAHPGRMAALASRLAGVPIEFDAIETDWHGFTPSLWLRNLRVGGRTPLRLGDVRVAIDWRALPWWRHNLPLEILLRDTHLEVIREPDGRTHILGLLAGHSLAAPPSLLRVQNAQVAWHDRRRGVRITRAGLDLTLRARGDRGRLHLRAADGTLELRADVLGGLTSAAWSARVWARGRRLAVVSLLQPYLPRHIRLTQAELDFQLWSNWHRGSHKTTRLIVEAGDTRLEAAGRPPLTIERLGGDLLYQHRPEGWRLQAARLVAQTAVGEAIWPATDLALRADAQGHHLAVRVLDLAAAAPLADLFPLPTPLADYLRQARPTGRIETLRLVHRPGPAADWSLQLAFAHLAARPWQKLPGFSGLSGRLSAADGELAIDLASGASALELPRLFRDPLYFTRLGGRLHWRATANGWRLEAPDLRATSPDIDTRTRLAIEGRPGKPPWLDIQTSFIDGDGSRAARYYPVGIMKPQLVAWLERAIRYGRVTRGGLLLVGPADHFPYHKTRDGHFEVLFHTQGLRLDYHPDWPPLRQARAQVRFHGNRLDIDGREARILDSRVTRFTARLASLKPLAPLMVSARIRGPLKDELHILRETPLAATLAHHVEGLTLSGQGDLSMQLELPWHDRPARFTGTLALRDATLAFPAHDLVLEALEGTLKITPTGVEASAGALALGGPVSITLAPEGDFTLIQARGKVAATALLDRYPTLAAAAPAGTLPYEMALWLPRDAQGVPRLRIDSPLTGVSLDLPPPLGKTADQSLPLSLDLALGPWPRTLTLRAGDRLDLEGRVTADGEIDLRIQTARLPLRPWLAWLGRLPTGGGRFRLQRLDLSTPKLEACPLGAAGFSFSARRRPGDTDRWTGRLAGDRIAGRFTLAQGILTARLARLWLQSCPDQPPGTTPTPRPLDLPGVDLQAEDFRFNQAKLGHLALSSRPGKEGQVLKTLAVSGPLATLEANGAWFRAGRRDYSHLQGHLTSDDLGRFLRETLDLNFLQGSRAYLSFDLHWDGPPHRFALQHLEGGLQLDMTAGRFLNVKPGAARILGLLNLRTIGRRLQFDFKDVYEKGLAFDTILGMFRLDQGTIYTNDLEINAPAATIRIAGSTDLIHRTHDQVLTLSPRLDATLTVAGAILGGPTTGLAVFAAQQLFSDKLERIQRIRYRIKGSWDAPRLEPLDQPAAASGIDILEP